MIHHRDKLSFVAQIFVTPISLEGLFVHETKLVYLYFKSEYYGWAEIKFGDLRDTSYTKTGN